VNVYLYDPTARFFQVVVELKNVPGALRDLLTVLRDMNLNVLSSFSSTDRLAKTGVWSAFVEDSEHTASELKRKISSARHVVDSIVVESKNGYLVDGIHFPLTFNTGDRAVMMRAEYLTKMLASVRKEFGSGGEVIIYEEGRVYGNDVAVDYAERLGADLIRSNFSDVLKLYTALGWFKLEGLDENRQNGTVTMQTSGCFECEGRKSQRPYSHFVRGHLGGFLSVLLGEELECEEVRCIAKGDRFCEFKFKPRNSGG
jgi:predicted hydrocarbon binding protein